MSKIQYKKFVPHQAEEALVEKYIDYLEKRHQAYSPLDMMTPRDVRRRSLRNPPSETWKSTIWIALDNDNIVANGYFGFSNLENETNPEKCEIHVMVLPEYKGKGIGKQLLKRLVEEAKQNDKSNFHTFHSTQYTCDIRDYWIEKTNSKMVLEEIESRLYRDQINHQFINDTLSALEKRLSMYQFKDYKLDELYDRFKKDRRFAEELADFRTEIINLIPRGEETSYKDITLAPKDIENKMETQLSSPWDVLTYFAFDGDKIIGMSEIAFGKNKPVKFAETGITGVRKEYHKKGIAKILKIKIILLALKLFPDLQYFSTENAETNAAMLSINKRLGFSEVYRWKEYEGKVCDIEKYLCKNQKKT